MYRNSWLFCSVWNTRQPCPVFRLWVWWFNFRTSIVISASMRGYIFISFHHSDNDIHSEYAYGAGTTTSQSRLERLAKMYRQTETTSPLRLLVLNGWYVVSSLHVQLHLSLFQQSRTKGTYHSARLVPEISTPNRESKSQEPCRWNTIFLQARAIAPTIFGLHRCC